LRLLNQLSNFSPLDDTSDFDLLLPPQWTGEHCALRLCEGFKTLGQLPITGAALGLNNSYLPVAHLYE